uniref:Uncharacterized protein n=1 Tax=Physcomitrium patens TaxID=3218 RepID=A0A2K1JTD8_PHYPA|nr:hypothetical protein PHYPA_014552 [Physcomitrium patens]
MVLPSGAQSQSNSIGNYSVTLRLDNSSSYIELQRFHCYHIRKESGAELFGLLWSSPLQNPQLGWALQYLF